MANTPNYMTGKHLTFVRLEPVGIAFATGLVSTIGADYDLVTFSGVSGPPIITLGVVDEIEFHGDRTGENISATNDVQMSFASLKEGNGFTLTEILRRGGAANSLLAGAYYAASDRMLQLTYYRANRGITVIGVPLSYTETIVEGKSVARLTCGPVDAGYPTTTTGVHPP